jgi:hypothetical protein
MSRAWSGLDSSAIRSAEGAATQAGQAESCARAVSKLWGSSAAVMGQPLM